MDASISAHIEITAGVCGGKPRIAGHRIRVQDIVVWSEFLGQTPDEIVANFPQISLADVHAALAYYFDHRDEIQEQLREDQRIVTEMKARFGPGPLAEKLARGGVDNGPISSG